MWDDGEMKKAGMLGYDLLVTMATINKTHNYWVLVLGRNEFSCLPACLTVNWPYFSLVPSLNCCVRSTLQYPSIFFVLFFATVLDSSTYCNLNFPPKFAVFNVFLFSTSSLASCFVFINWGVFSSSARPTSLRWRVVGDVGCCLFLPHSYYILSYFILFLFFLLFIYYRPWVSPRLIFSSFYVYILFFVFYFFFLLFARYDMMRMMQIMMPMIMIMLIMIMLQRLQCRIFTPFRL